MRDVRAASSGQIESSTTTVPVAKVASNFPKQPKFAPNTNAIPSILNASRQTKSAPVASSSQEVLPRPTISATTADHFPLDGAQTSSAPHCQGSTSKPSPVPTVETGGSLPSLVSMHPVVGEGQCRFSTRVNLHTITEGNTSRSALEEGETIHKETVPVEEVKAAQAEVSMIDQRKDVVLMCRHEMPAAKVVVERQEEISEQTNEFTPETSIWTMVAASGSSVPREIPKLVPVSAYQSASPEPTAAFIETISTALPTELSPEQQIALEGFKAFVSAFKDILAKSLSEIGEESCAELLKEVEDHLTAARNQKAQTEATQFEALTTLQSLWTEFTAVTKEVEDLQSKLAAMNERKEALVSQIGPLEQATMDREQVLQDLTVNVNQAEENSDRVTQELTYLKEDSSFWEAKRAGLLGDVKMRINYSLDKILSSFS
ncbi:hypothetical protein MRB53_009797 [Persea americana]|uniref:Uncharacterized protein n=1 Tax=Persea americana TaxID=3435 RepID=A0ACC2LQ92_PERAE|nr:hypothetical protein MRB53_009797 [Persea americana]